MHARANLFDVPHEDRVVAVTKLLLRHDLACQRVIFDGRVAEALERRLQAEGRALDVFVQVNSSGESSKYGLPPEEVAAFLQAMWAFSALRVRGFMTLALLSADAARVRQCFVQLRELRDRLRLEAPDGIELDELSMGMSGDYEIAIEEGATIVRVGQAIYGARSTPDTYYWPAAGAEESRP